MDAKTLASVITSVPVIIALVTVLKPWVPDTRRYPFIAIALGMGLNILAAIIVGTPLTATNVAVSLALGILAGLTASGAYSAVSTMREPAEVANKSLRPKQIVEV